MQSWDSQIQAKELAQDSEDSRIRTRRIRNPRIDFLSLSSTLFPVSAYFTNMNPSLCKCVHDDPNKCCEVWSVSFMRVQQKITKAKSTRMKLRPVGQAGTIVRAGCYCWNVPMLTDGLWFACMSWEAVGPYSAVFHGASAGHVPRSRSSSSVCVNIGSITSTPSQRPEADWFAAGMFVWLVDFDDQLMLLDFFDILRYCACNLIPTYLFISMTA
jgi:hypothetical protein